MSRKKVRSLSATLRVVFTLVLLAGVALMVWPLAADATDSAGKAGTQGKQGLPVIPIALVVVGIVGEVLLLMRVRVQWKSRKLSASGREHARGMTFIMGEPITELSPPEPMPLLVWWLVRNKTPIVRAEMSDAGVVV
jgi:hypothetical protein